jgi:hypothetical protein
MPNAYTGALCNTNADCGYRDKGTICARQHAADKTGTCLYPCDFVTPCRARDGVGHACVPFVGDDHKEADVCFPGIFGLPCFDNSACAVPDLECAGADLTDPAHPKPGLCTKLCTKDADCDGDVWTAGKAYCGGAGAVAVCLPLGSDGDACTAANQCATKTCALPPQATDMIKRCGGVAK